MRGREVREIVKILWLFEEMDAEGMEVRLVEGKLILLFSIVSSCTLSLV